MRAYKIVLLGVLLSVLLLIGNALLVYAGLMYIGDKMFEGGWEAGNPITGPDGYTYCLMYETGLMQDPKTKLIRTKNLKDEHSYEDLGTANTVSSWLRVVRSTDAPLSGNNKFYCTSNKIIVARGHFKKVAFAYDINHNQFYDEHGDNEVSPFLLLDENSSLYKPDVFWVIFLVVEDYYRHLESVKYLKSEFPDKKIELEHRPTWPKPKMLRKGLQHPNDEVKKLSRWLSEIQENGYSRESETIAGLIEYLQEHETSNNQDIREHIATIFKYTCWNE